MAYKQAVSFPAPNRAQSLDFAMACLTRARASARGATSAYMSSQFRAGGELTCRMTRTTTRGSSPRVVTAVRLPEHLHAELQRQSKERDVSVNFLITRAVEHYLRQLSPADPLVERDG